MNDSNATAEAEASFSAAIAAARERYAKLPELRATVSLGCLLAKQDKRDGHERYRHQASTAG
jgi:hypothetical protein